MHTLLDSIRQWFFIKRAKMDWGDCAQAPPYALPAVPILLNHYGKLTLKTILPKSTGMLLDGPGIKRSVFPFKPENRILEPFDRRIWV
jgi:hypothetical protein